MDQVIVLPELWVLPVAALIPVLVALAFKASTGSGPRQILALVLTGVVSVVEQLISDGGSIESFIATFVLVMLTQLGTYLSTNKTLLLNQRVAPEFGLAA